MPFYVKLGKVPKKRHTTFYKEDGKSLYREELFGTKGFSGIYSNKYHLNLPPQVEKIREIFPYKDTIWSEAPIKYYHFMTHKTKQRGNFIFGRSLYLFNDNCRLSSADITEDSEDFYRNSTYSELIFIHSGSGTLYSEYGEVKFGNWDYLVIPKGTTYQLKFDSFEKTKLFIIESSTPFEIPPHFRNEYGQLSEDSPYCERDFRVPELCLPIDKKGEFKLVVNLNKRHFEYVLPYHPFDVVGWDGYLYPYAFNIKEYSPKVAQIHLPPPSHLLFVTQSFVVCNFVPRPFDFHPDAIPIPYFHSNIDSDEVLYYVDGDFMSRKGIEPGSVTLHPMGIPHGPQPGKTEASLSMVETFEYAVMVDTFAPLKLTLNLKECEVQNYEQSWNI